VAFTKLFFPYHAILGRAILYQSKQVMDMPHMDPSPLYQRIAHSLIQDISAGRLLEGQKLPPERELAKELSTSLGTLRKALSELEKKGFIERIQGSGNYIKLNKSYEVFHTHFRLETPLGRGVAGAELCGLDWMKRPKGVLPTSTASMASRVRRIRFLDQTPVALEEIWLDGGWGALQKDKIQTSLYASYRQQFGIFIGAIEDRVGVSHIPRWRPGSFPLFPGATCGYIERNTWAETSEPIEFSRTWFDPERAQYVQRMK
jgi:GntR family transcriptional regulator